MTDLLELRDEPPSRASRRRGRGGSVLGRLLAVVVVLALLGGLAVGAVLVGRAVLGGSAPADYDGTGSGEVVVQVMPGDTAGNVADALLVKDVVKSRLAFFEVARADDRSKGLQPGFYRLRLQMSAADALDLLLDPTSRLIGRVTVPEGFSVQRTLPVLAAATELPLADFEAAVKDPAALGLPAYANGSVEGFLFPATYDIEPGTDAAGVLKLMVARYTQAARTVDLETGAKAIGRTPYDVLRTASLLEREAKLAEEFPKVARVVYNRLDRGMPLQFDSTVNFLLDTPKGRLTLKDIDVDSPYNSYKNKGLPPTPISSPGERALQAALAPAEGNYVFFITIAKDGTSLFTNDYDEFLRAKAKSQSEGVY